MAEKDAIQVVTAGKVVFVLLGREHLINPEHIVQIAAGPTRGATIHLTAGPTVVLSDVEPLDLARRIGAAVWQELK